MLGLRKGFTVRRKQNSAASSLNSDLFEEPNPSRVAMDSMRNGLHEPLNGNVIQPIKPSDAVSVSTMSIADSIDSGESTSTYEESTATTSLVRSSTSSPLDFSRIPEITRSLRNLICKLDDYDDTFIHDQDLHSYLHYIADERLIHMPRKGSDWDRVLRNAQFFGLQVWSFGEKIEKFATKASDLAVTALASCQILLELGHTQAPTLLPTFMALYELGLLLSQVLQVPRILEAPAAVKHDIGNLYAELVQLVCAVAVHYRRRISRLSDNAASTIDFDGMFGSHIDKIWKKKTDLCDRLWNTKLSGKNYPITLHGLRHKLNPTPTTFRGSLYAELAEDLERAETTCEWIKDDLVEFLREDEKLLSVTGNVGTGKTVLADWIEERLQRFLDNRTYNVFLYTFPFDSSEDATPLAFLKGLLFQLLDRSIGNVELFEALVEAFKFTPKDKGDVKLESSLWRALQTGLKTFRNSNEPIILLVDGIDEVSGSQSPLEFHKTLKECLSKLATTRAITFSRPVSHLSDGCRHIVLPNQESNRDIKTFLRQTLIKSAHFTGITLEAQEKLLDSLSTKSKGSFLWARLVSRILLKSSSHDVMLKTGEGMSSNVDEVLKKVLEHIELKDTTLQYLLSFMLVSEQPIMVQEMAEILSLNVPKRLKASPVDVMSLVSRNFSELIDIKDGSLHFKSSVIKSYLHKQMGKSLPSPKEAHHQLTLRMLYYAKLCIGYSHEPSVDGFTETALKEILGRHSLMNYVMSNWIFHFRASSLCGAKGELALSKEFKDIFSESTTFAQLERAFWETRMSKTDTVHHLELTLRIREDCFGEKHTAVLQSLIILGNLHEHHAEQHEAARYFYRATKLGQVILSKFSPIVVTCSGLFMVCTDTLIITKRTEIVTYREEIIRFTIEICKRKHGASSDEVIVWYKRLMKLYMDIKEEHMVVIVYKELYEIIIGKNGKDSGKASDLVKFFVGLKVSVNGISEGVDIETYRDIIFTGYRGQTVSGELRFDILLKLALSYEHRRKWCEAEQLYLHLWRQISVPCRTEATILLHITKIKIALEYIRFLREQKRIEEASNILICLWAEYEHFHCESETIIVLIREIGVLFKAFGMLTVAMFVFRKIWGWFKDEGKTSDDEAQRTTILITEVVEEITETTITTKTVTKTTTEVTETVIREVFETHFTRCKKGKADASFLKACLTLINLYIKQENWGEAEIIIRRTLEIIWKAVLTLDTKITLTEHFRSECILVATQLAICYRRQRQFEKAERVYLQIYYACLAAFSLEDKFVCQAFQVLVAFYEEHHRHERVIEIYIEMIEKRRKKLGASHHLTIETLYILAARCELLGRQDAYKYYLEIVVALNKGIKHCHHDAFNAAVILCRYYRSEKRWSELREICAGLWETFIHHHGECAVFTEEIISFIHETYLHVLEVHVKVEFSVLYKLSVEYRETVVRVFGASSSLVILAMIALAQICEKNEKHHHESIMIYEEVIKKMTTTKTTTTTITETTIHTVKKRLSKFYVQIITSGGSTSPTTIDRAIVVCLEAYALLKIEYGCWHEKTLLKLKEIVILYKKLGTKESHTKIIELLQVSVISIVTTLKTSSLLFEAATTLASIYVAVGMTKQGHDLLHQLRHLLIFRDTLPSTAVTLKLDITLSRVVYLFLAAFEHRLTENITITYSELLATLLNETLLYEEYSLAISTPASIEVILVAAARLRVVWEVSHNTALLSILDARILHLFKSSYKAAAGSEKDDHTRLFLLALLAELATDRTTTTPDLPSAASKAVLAAVRVQLKVGEYARAEAVARIGLALATHLQSYHRREGVVYGYRLAEVLAGVDGSSNGKNTAARPDSTLETSRRVVAEVLCGMRATGILVESLRAEDVAGLVRLLGAQRNFVELERILLALWRSREVQRTWKAERVLSVGRLVVHCLAALGKRAQAIEMADLLWYNLRQGRGWLDPDTVAVAQLLASLYVDAGRVAEAMGVHEAVLREIEAAWQGAGANVDGNGPNGHHDVLPEDRTLLTAHARLHLELLKGTHVQMKGWTKSEREFKDLYGRLKNGLDLQLPAFEKWAASPKEKGTTLQGGYVAPTEWKIDGDSYPVRPNGGVKKRVSSRLDVVQMAQRGWSMG